jgi:large subunit ribosomal protein L4e
MKAQILDINGNKKSEITVNLFQEPIREDIISKVVEAEKIRQPHSNKYRAGMNRSASGNIRNAKGAWKSRIGRGLSRVPRKVFWRRGTQFSWEGAIIPSVKGGRRAHPPKGSLNLRKINKKEFKKALFSALTSVSSVDEIKKKYSSLKDKKIDIQLPIIVEDKILSLKTKEFLTSLKKILKNLSDVAVQKKAVRPGKGKLRGRKYKKNAGLLFIIGKDERKRMQGIDIIKANQLLITDLAAGGARLTMFTEKAIKELEDFKAGKKVEAKK